MPNYKPVQSAPKLTPEQRKELYGKVGAFNFAGQLIDVADCRSDIRDKMEARGLANGVHWYAYTIVGHEMNLDGQNSRLTVDRIYREIHYHCGFGGLIMKNVFIPPSQWECDVLSVRESLYFAEYEVKLSKQDYTADFRNKREKHEAYANGHDRYPIPKEFYFVTPEGMIDEVPPYCGLIWVREDAERRIRINKIKDAPRNRFATKLTHKQLFNVATKASCRLLSARS